MLLQVIFEDCRLGRHGPSRSGFADGLGFTFGHIRQTLRITPAMAAGVADHVWSPEEVVGLLYPTAMVVSL